MPETVNTEGIKIRPSDLPPLLKFCITARQPVCVWSQPGVGKSSITAQATRSMGLSFFDFRASLREPTDVLGFPYVKDGRAHTAIPSFWPDDGEGVIFLDELNRSTAMMQNALLQLVLDRGIGEYRLPDGWAMIAACNYESDGGGVQRMSSALTNRFLHVHVEPNIEDFSSYALQNGFSTDIIAFLQKFNGNLFKFDRNAKAWPSPRSWEFVNRVLEGGLAPEHERVAIAGCIGEGEATSFCGYLELRRKLPDIDDILANPKSCPIPSHKEISVKYAILMALARKVANKIENFEKAVDYIKRFSSAGKTLEMEYLMSFLDVCQRELALPIACTPTYTKLAQNELKGLFSTK